MRQTTLTLALLLAFALPATAQEAPKPITAGERQAVIARLASELQAKYVFPDVAEKLAASIKAREASGAYSSAADTRAFAEALSKDLRTLGKDGHFSVKYEPDFRPRPQGVRRVPSSEEVQQGRESAAQFGYGIESLARLPGNVGYLELKGFGPTELVGEALSAAMTLLTGTDALIVDLRRNGGGEPGTVAYLMSHFFALGDQRHLNDIYSRTENTTRQYWTNTAVNPRYTKPVYVLNSSRTASAAEEFAYNFQTQKRGTVVGETSAGGANHGATYALANGMVAFIPNGRLINPITKTNWEHVGVKPDVAVPAGDAQKVAHAAALRTLIAASKDADEKAGLQALVAQVEAGKVDPLTYAPSR